MNRICVLALSGWAHHSWFPRSQRALTERALAAANASLIACFPQLSELQAKPAMPRFATLPRPACAKVLRVTAAFARARSLRKVVSAAAHEKFARSIAPRVLCAVQRDRRGEHDDTDFGAALNVFDRADMTAAGLCLALHTIGDPNLRVLVQLRLPRTLARRAAHFTVGDMSARAARDLLDTAYTLAGGEPC